MQLKGDTHKATFFDLTPAANDGIWAVDDGGAETEKHTYWNGVPNRTAAGLRFETKSTE